MERRIVQVSFYFDPSCPWCWMTSRWIAEIQLYRDLTVTWKPFSLEIKNTGVDVPAQYRPGMRLGLRALRVIEAAKKEFNADMDSIGRFYTALGMQLHNEGAGAKASIARAIEETGWPSELHYHENSDEFDAIISKEMDKALTLSGSQDVGVPLLMVEGETPVVFFGPILTPTPRGEEATELWDAFVVLTKSASFHELKKHKSRVPDFS